MERSILLLGNPALYNVATEYKQNELGQIAMTTGDLHDTLLSFRRRYGLGRAIAAPQIGVPRRLIYMFIDEPRIFINPTLIFPDYEMMPVRDDCMSFPGLFVNVMRHRRAIIKYKDMKWEDRAMALEGDLSELLQHEYDHLDGILATMRSVDNKSFFYNEI